MIIINALANLFFIPFNSNTKSGGYSFIIYTRSYKAEYIFKMADENIKGLIIGVVIKILVVVGIGTAIAFWYMSKI